MKIFKINRNTLQWRGARRICEIENKIKYNECDMKVVISL